LVSQALVIETDSDIVREYAGGNTENAATAFVRKYQKFVFSTALRFLNSYDDADDAAQEVFIKALGSLKNFRGDSSLKTWLYRITTNYCINMKRKNKFFGFFKSIDDEVSELKNLDILPDKNLENAEFEKKFLKAMSKLPEKQRETFALRYFEELSYDEISKMVGTSVGGLKANYFQAVKKLSDILKPELI
jgi:RNA polymerase sigma factor (sigma-70 family)